MKVHYVLQGSIKLQSNYVIVFNIIKESVKTEAKRPSFINQLIIFFSRNATAWHFIGNRLLIGTVLFLEG